jgi:hypothetical protein
VKDIVLAGAGPEKLSENRSGPSRFVNGGLQSGVAQCEMSSDPLRVRGLSHGGPMPTRSGPAALSCKASRCGPCCENATEITSYWPHKTHLHIM